MASYITGKETRQTILDTCRKLFYEKGYNETTYDDICENAHVNRGSIHYHFKTKDAIRWEIESSIYHKNVELAEMYTDDSKYTYAFASNIYWYKYFNDEKYRRFFYSGYCSNDPLKYVDENYVKNIFLCFDNKENVNFSEKYALEILTVAGLEKQLGAAIHNNPNRFTCQQINNYFLSTLGKVFNIDNCVIDEICNHIQDLMKSVPTTEILAQLTKTEIINPHDNILKSNDGYFSKSESDLNSAK